VRDQDLGRGPGCRIGEQRRIEPVEHHLGLMDRPPEHVELAGIDRARFPPALGIGLGWS
jgi:hypothetical protein